MAVDSLDLTVMNVSLDKSGLLTGSANLLDSNGKLVPWFGGSDQIDEFIEFMQDIEEGLFDYPPTKLKYKFFEPSESDNHEEVLIEDLSKIPTRLRELAGINL